MSDRETYTAVLDRFEDDLAVFVVELDDGLDELVVDADDLPSDARRQDAVVEVTFEDGDAVDFTYRAEETERRSESARERFERLARRPPGREEAGGDRETEGTEEAEEDETEANGDESDGDESNPS